MQLKSSTHSYCISFGPINLRLLYICSAIPILQTKTCTEKTVALLKNVARHSSHLNHGFDNYYLDQTCNNNADKAHFLFNMNDGGTLGFVNDQEVWYADGTSGS